MYFICQIEVVSRWSYAPEISWLGDPERRVSLSCVSERSTFTYNAMDPELAQMMQQAQGRGGPQPRGDFTVPDKYVRIPVANWFTL